MFKKWLSKLHNDVRGAINQAGLLMMGIAMVFVAVGFIIYPIILTGTDAILAYESTACATYTDASFTGLTATVGIVPLICLLGFVSAAVISGFFGYKMVKSGSGTLSPQALIMLGIGQIFIAIGLIIFPIVLDGCVAVLLNASLSSYTGLEAIIKVVPLIVLVAFIAAGVVSQYFGVSTLKKSAA